MWLSPNYPLPDRKDVVKVAFRSHRLARTHAQNGTSPSPVPSPFNDRRLNLLHVVTKSKLVKITSEDLLDGTAKNMEGVDAALIAEMKECFDIAIHVHLESTTGISREILSAENRIGDAEAEKTYERLMANAWADASESALLMLWYRRMAKLEVMQALTTWSKNSTDRIKLLASAHRRLPEAFTMTKLMQHAERNPWEAHVGSLFERRLMERVIEEDEIAEMEKRHRIS
jgi:hypothetical protein